MEVVGGQSVFETPQVNEFLRGYMNERLISQLSKYDLVTVFSKLEEVSFKVKTAITEELARIGIQLIDLKFEGIDTTPEYRERLFWLKQTGATTTVLQMDTAKSVAESLSKSPGAALGAGMVIIPPIMQPQPTQQAQPQQQAQPATAPVVGTQTAPTTAIKINFCPNCGTDLRNLPTTPKFCPNCGLKLT
jgi:membrane protease subunit (stomatin/prohibitin family)